MKPKPFSCDTFAVLPPGSDGCVVFGKNSDRLSYEVQEVVYFPAADYSSSAKVKCTYIEIDQQSHTYATVLSKPSWLWGAEMGANEHGLCIGNEAVWTSSSLKPESVKRLLGMDYVRLGLERAKTAVEAVDVITKLLEIHGQGGNCFEDEPFTYHNSYLIADATEVWVLETVDKLWAAEKVTTGVRNISNCYSIGSKIDLSSNRLEARAEELGLWKPSSGPFNFANAFGYPHDEDDDDRYGNGKRLLSELSLSGKFNETDMFHVLRDEQSGICMSHGSYLSTGSQVSIIRPPQSGKPNIHYFTATPDPSKSLFKPFVFAQDAIFPSEVISPVPARPSDRRHHLYKLQEESRHHWRKQTGAKLREVELSLVELAATLTLSEESSFRGLFDDAVKAEMNIYK